MQTLYYDAPSNTSRRSSSYGSTTYTTTVGLFIVVVVVTVVLLVTTTVGCFIVEEEEEEEPKNCFNICQNLLYCSLSYSSTYIGTPKFLVKVLWVYSHLKSDFFCLQKVTYYSLT